MYHRNRKCRTSGQARQLSRWSLTSIFFVVRLIGHCMQGCSSHSSHLRSLAHRRNRVSYCVAKGAGPNRSSDRVSYCYAQRAGPNRSLAASNFLRLGSLGSASPKTAPSLGGVGFLTFVVVACSRRARWRATKSARSVSLHFCSFFRRGFRDLTSSGCCC